MIFKSRKNWWNSLIIWASNLLCMVFVIRLGWSSIGSTIVNIIMIGTSALLFSFLYGTYYELKDTFFIYRSGPIGAKIKISDIKEIHVGHTMYVGIKPALATKGLIVKYYQYDEVYISPDTNDSFVEAILKINPEITVIR